MLWSNSPVLLPTNLSLILIFLLLETASGIGQSVGGQIEKVNGPYDRGSGISAVWVGHI